MVRMNAWFIVSPKNFLVTLQFLIKSLFCTNAVQFFFYFSNKEINLINQLTRLMWFQVGTMEFMGHADLPQQAKHNAAVQALPYLHQMPDIKKASKVAAVPANNKKANTEAASVTPQGKNVIMVLNEIAMSQGVCMDWTMVDEDGPPHMRAFTWTLKMGSYEAVGSGNSKKLAKAIAAQNMYQVSFSLSIHTFIQKF